MENSCPCLPQNVFGSFSFGISDGRAYSMFHVPTCAQRSSPKVSQVFRQCSDHFSDQFGGPFSDQCSDQFPNQFPNQCFRPFFWSDKFCGHGCGQGWGRVFWTRFRGSGRGFRTEIFLQKNCWVFFGMAWESHVFPVA